MKKQILFILLIVVGYRVMAQTILGIDVSHYNGTINWAQVSAAGKTFGYIKATEGVSYTDPTYTTYLTNGSSAGVIMGSYHFARPETNSAVNEANYYLSVAGSSIGTNRLPPALDLEDPPTGTGLTSYFTSAQLTAWAQTWMSTVQNATGIAPVIYTSGSIASYLNSSINTYKLWIANPGTSSGTPPANIGVWTTWAIKQYSWTGVVTGISGSVDLDVYNGTTADFNNWIGTVPCNAPSNDNCPGTSITSNGACLTGTVACSTGSYGANQCAGCTCTSPDDRDVYYSFVAQATSHTVTLSNYASDFDAVMELRTACAYNTALGCYDPSGIPTSVSNTWNNLTIGNTYYIRIFEYNYSGSTPSSPTFDICVTHTVCSPPNTISFTGILSACSAGTTTVAVSASNCTGCTFQWSGGMGSGASKNLSPGTYTVTVTSSCGGSATGTVTVSTLPNPNSPVISTTGTCNPVSVSANSSGCSGCSYSWTTPSGSNSGATISGISSGTYSVTITDANTCTASNSLSVTVNQIPSASISPSSVSICNGASATLTASGGGTYLWSNNATTAAITVSPASNTSYTVTVTLNGCTATATRNVTVGSPPTVSITPLTATICNGENTTLTASGGGTYLWSNNATTAAITVNPSGNTTYTVTVTLTGCSATASANVFVNAIPSANISPAAISICNGTSTMLTASGGGTYVWSNSLGTNAQVSVSPVNQSTYFVTVTNANNCSVSASSTVTINALPSASISPNSISICNGASTTLTASGGGTYAWSNSLGSNAQVSVSPTNTTFYTVTVTNANNCSSSATASVIVNTTPGSPAFSPASGCSPVTVTATSANCNVCSYQWSTGSTNTTSTFTAGTNYTVTATDNNNCSASAAASVIVNTTPDAPTFSPVSGCDPVAVTATCTNCNGCSYQWSSGSTNSTAVFSSTASFTVTATGNNNCSASANGTVTVNGQPSVSIISSAPGFCAGNSVTLSTNQTASSYSWVGPNSFTSAASQITINTAGSYSFTVTNPGSCTGTVTASMSIVQYSSPVANAGVNQTNTGAGVTIGGNPTASGGQVPYTYSWNPTSTLDNSTLANPLANPASPTTYTVIVTDNHNCTATDNVDVSVQINCAPVADFSAPTTAGFAPFTANFADNSANTPTLWEWIFSGGNPPTSSVQSPVVVYNTAGIYDVSLKVTNSCGADSITKTQYINVIATGIEIVSAIQNISVFPNPNTGIFALKIESESNQQVKLNLFNSFGQLITKRDILTNTKLTQTNFDLSGSAKGVYFIQIFSAGHYYYLKVLVE